MGSFIVALNAVAPIFLMLGLGYMLRRTMRLEKAVLKTMNALCFQVFLPLLLFNNICSSDLRTAVHVRLILFCVSVVLLLFFLLSLLVPVFETERRRQGVLIQGILRSNFIILGIPITASLYGQENLGAVSILTAFVVPLFNALAVWTLSVHSQEHTAPGKILRDILKNPLIIATAAGCLCLVFSLRLPVFLQTTITDVGKIATPLSIIILGANLDFPAIRKNRTALTAAVICRLLAIPFLAVAAAVALGFRNGELVAVLTVFGTPSAISSYVMAEQMGGDSELAGQMVVFSSAFSCLSLFLFILMLKHFGVI